MPYSVWDFAADMLQMWTTVMAAQADTILFSCQWVAVESNPRPDGHPRSLPSALLSTIIYAVLEVCFTVANLWVAIPPWILVLQSFSMQFLSVVVSMRPLAHTLIVDAKSATPPEKTESQQPADQSWLDRLSPLNVSLHGWSYLLPLAASAWSNASVLLFQQNTASAFDTSPRMVLLDWFALILFWIAALVKNHFMWKITDKRNINSRKPFLDFLCLQCLQLAIKLPLRKALGLDPFIAFRKIGAAQAAELYGEARYQWLFRINEALPSWFPMACSLLAVVLSGLAGWFGGRVKEKYWQVE